MAARMLLPLGGWALALVTATGCTHLPGRGSQTPATPPAGVAPGKSDPAPTDDPPKASTAPGPVAGALVPAAAAGTAPTNVVPAGGQPPVPTLPPASPLPPPAALSPQPTQPPAPQPMTGTPGAALPVPLPVPQPLPDPHKRDTPTAGGAILNLAPGELPLDRMVEMQRQADAVAGQNAVLAARVRELMSQGKDREHALAEAVREVETAAAETARAKGEAAAARLDAATVRAQLERQEREEIETLRAVVAALERLLNPTPPARREP
ncbi:hypothetical protein J0H58_10035 [bacterium]|nr:hypothetical protein [bacterium]